MNGAPVSFASRRFGLADAGRADHEDVLRRNLRLHLLRQLLPPPAVAHGDGDAALSIVLADDVAVELHDDLARRHLPLFQRLSGDQVSHANSSTATWPLV
jgi:hypothetical protein